MKIVNNTKLSYREIGLIIDELQDENKGDTNYYGKYEIYAIEYKKQKIIIHIRYLKKFVEWRFDYE